VPKQSIVLRIARPMSDDVNTKLRLLALLRADWAASARAAPSPVALAFPQFFAVAAHRVSHALWRGGHPRLSRGVMVLAQVLTGAEISGAATIGPGLRLTHTGGIVVGTGVVAGANLVLYSGVLLGNHSPGRPGTPTLGADVRVCSKASVLGPVTVGDGAVIGAHALVIDDVPAGAKVRAPVAVVA
jgi:serine O-acetyltransferase